MKKWLFTLCAVLMLSGCAAPKEEPTNTYERSTEMGNLNKLAFADVQKKMENKETFMFVFTYDQCSVCISFKKDVLSTYIKDHGFDFNEVELQNEKDGGTAAQKFVDEHPHPEEFLQGSGFEDEPNALLTPTFYFVVEGELKEEYMGGPSEKEFDDLIVKYQLDKVKE